MAGPAPDGDAGGVALLMLCGGLAALMAGLLVLSAVTDAGVAAARARTAADAAALAAVSVPTIAVTSPAAPLTAGAAGGCALARDLAEANGATLTACTMPIAGAVSVEVSVRPRSPWVHRLIGDLPARAAAVLEPQR